MALSHLTFVAPSFSMTKIQYHSSQRKLLIKEFQKLWGGKFRILETTRPPTNGELFRATQNVIKHKGDSSNMR